ncbi:hypothetical protein ES702_07830 [subsurface metagenome]
MSKCLKCGRRLTNPESIKRQYGKTCFRIIQLQKQKQSIDILEIRQYIRQEIKRFMKIQNVETSIIPIEVNIPPKKISKTKMDFTLVVNELKQVFQNGIEHYLQPIQITI